MFIVRFYCLKRKWPWYTRCMNPSIEPIKKLVEGIVYPFYQVDRDMELPIRERVENDAEHSWSLAFVACALAPSLDPSLDIGKVAQFAVVHDLVEIHSGDVSVWDKNEGNHQSKEELETQAFQKIKTEYVDHPWIAQTIEAYERKDSNEANYVWAMDKYLAHYMRYTHAKPFFFKNNITKKHFDKSIARMRHKATAHPAVGKLYDDLIAEYDKHPDWFPQ